MSFSNVPLIDSERIGLTQEEAGKRSEARTWLCAHLEQLSFTASSFIEFQNYVGISLWDKAPACSVENICSLLADTDSF